MDQEISSEASRYLSLAKTLASAVRKELAPEIGSETLDDFAKQGLVEGIGQFRPRQGLTLRTFLTYRIQLAIYQGLSAHQWPDDESRRRYIFQKKSNELLLHFHLSAEGSVKRSIQAEQDEISYLLRLLSIVALLARGTIGHAVRTLGQKEQNFLRSYYDEDLTIEASAGKIGLYPAAAMRLHVRILETIAAKL